MSLAPELSHTKVAHNSCGSQGASSPLRSSRCRTEGGTLDTTDVPAHESALQAAMGLAKQAAAGDRFTPNQLQAASEVLKVPCAAMGLLLCMQHTLQDRGMWSGALEMLPAPAFLALMLVVVPLQPQMGPKVNVVSSTCSQKKGRQKYQIQCQVATLCTRALLMTQPLKGEPVCVSAV